MISRLAAFIVYGAYVCIAAFGVFLLGLNVVGLWLPLRNEAIYTEPRNLFPDDITLTEAELRTALARKSEEADATYARRATVAIQQGIAHYWYDEKPETYHLRVPPYENYLLWALGGRHPNFRWYQFVDSDKAIERGIGLCSQHAMILTDALNRNGIAAHVVDISSKHVVVTAHIDGRSWVLDPDYGVAMPYSLATLAAEPNHIRDAYAASGPAAVEFVTSVYPLPHRVFPTIGDYVGPLATIERTSYRAIWILPLACFIVASLPLWRCLPHMARLPISYRGAMLRPGSQPRGS